MAITGSPLSTRPALVLVPPDQPAPVAQRLTEPLASSLHVPDGVQTVPAEHVLLLAVDLPAMPAAQRRAAVGFAVEDRIAQSLDEVQVALGPQLAAGVWLVAVTDRTVLTTVTVGNADRALWPDVLLVPTSKTGWSVWAGGGRALVRLADGTGFATSPETLPAFWAAAGSPEITLYGGSLPSTIPVTARAPLPDTFDPSLTGFDLRSGQGRVGGRLALPRGVRPFLMVVCAAALAHLALLALDVAALDRLVGQREGELRGLLNAPADSNLDAALTQALAARQPATEGALLALLTRLFAALEPQAGRVSVQDLRYTAADNAAILTLEAPDLATLQAVETALTGAGLAVTAGAATTSDGAAEVQMTIRGGGA